MCHRFSRQTTKNFFIRTGLWKLEHWNLRPRSLTSGATSSIKNFDISVVPPLTLVCNFLMPQQQALGCSSSPCQNGGKCIDTCPLVPPNFRCECEEVYFGDVCQHWTGNTKPNSKPSRLLVPRFQNESSYHTFHVKMSLICMTDEPLGETHINGFVWKLVLTKRQKVTGNSLFWHN